MNRRYYKNSMSSIQQFLDPWGYIIFLKYETSLEKPLMKFQNLTSYNTSLEFFYIKANVRLQYFCFITLNHLNLIFEKHLRFLH